MKARPCKNIDKVPGDLGDMVRAIEERRVAMNIKATDFALQTGYSYEVWSKICNGHSANPGVKMMMDFARVVGLRISAEVNPRH